MEISNKFPEMLRLLLRQKNITHAQLANILGVKRSSVSMYCIGKARPDFENLQKIASFFGVSLDFLVNGESPENKITREELGLSERALQILKQIAHDEKHAVLSQYIDKLICDEDFRTTYERTCSELGRKASQYPEIKWAYETERRKHEDNTGEYQTENDTLNCDDYMRLIETRATIEMHECFQRFFERVNMARYAYGDTPNEYFGETKSGWVDPQHPIPRL